MSKGGLLSAAFAAAARGQDVCIRMKGRDLKRLAIALHNQRNGSGLMELFKNASIEIIAKNSFSDNYGGMNGERLRHLQNKNGHPSP